MPHPSKFFVYQKGLGVVPIDKTSPTEGHFIHSDIMQPLQHPADMRWYDSPSQFRATTKRYGYEEVGNDKLSQRKRPTLAERIPGPSEGLKKRLWDQLDKATRR